MKNYSAIERKYSISFIATLITCTETSPVHIKNNFARVSRVLLISVSRIPVESIQWSAVIRPIHTFRVINSCSFNSVQNLKEENPREVYVKTGHCIFLSNISTYSSSNAKGCKQNVPSQQRGGSKRKFSHRNYPTVFGARIPGQWFAGRS